MLLCGIQDLWAPGAQSVSRGDGPFHIKKSSINLRKIKVSRVGIFRLVNSIFWSLSLGLVRGSTLNFYTFALSGVRGGRRARVSGQVGAIATPERTIPPPPPSHKKKWEMQHLLSYMDIIELKIWHDWGEWVE